MKLGIGVKIAGGFGVLIAMAIGLGGLAIWNMQTVKKTATELEVENVPEVAVANNVERTSLEIMFMVRGYAYTENAKFLEDAKAELVNLKGFLKEAKDLGAKYGIKELKDNAAKADEKVAEYEKLLGQTVEATNAMGVEKANSLKAADLYMKQCYDYLEAQDSKLHEEIKEGNASKDVMIQRLEKISTVNEIVDIGNLIRIGTWQSIANRDPKLFTETQGKFADVTVKLEKLKATTKEDSNLKLIENCKNAGKAYSDCMTNFLAKWNEREELNRLRNIAADGVLKAAKDTSMFGLEDTRNGTKDAVNALASATLLMVIGLGVVVVIGVIFSWIITSGILKPVNRSAEIANTLASQAEELSTVSSSLLSSSEQMSAQSNTVSAATEQMSANINAMASAAEEMNVNTQSVASASEQMSRNVANVAGAIEELSASMSSVSDKAKGGTHVASAAMKTSKDASETMNALGTAAQEIGQVTEVIKRIAEQTNLLALNATIEAASAGDAGKGFAVVANEIKELANQSAQAAEDIAKRIRGVQGKTDEAVKAIAEVSGVIVKLSETAESIDSLVTEQTKATNDMSANVTQANTGVNNITSSIKEVAEGTKEMSRNAGEAAKGATEVSSNIAEVKTASVNTSGHATQVNSSATELSKLAGELKLIVSEIKGS